MSRLTIEEYPQWDAWETAEKIRSKVVCAEEVLASAQEMILLKNPQINAVVTTFFDEVEEQLAAADPSSPLFGVPFLIKDLGISFKDRISSGASRFVVDEPASADSHLMARFRQLGLITLGQTNTPEFGALGVTESQTHGICVNPFNPKRNSGGSSGGSAAAIASGMVPIAHGGDGGGSIRIPASYCGLVGLKPSRGLVPQGPDNFDAWFGLVTNGILSKSVRDTALVLSHISGPEKGAPYECPSIREQFLPALEQKSEQFKIAYCPTPLLAPSYDDEVEQALHRTVARLKSIGHELVPLDPPVPPKEATQAYLKIFTLGLCQQINGIARQTLRKPKSRYFDPSTWFIYSLGQSLRATDLGEAIQFSRQLSYKLATIYERFDFLLTPTACSVPVKNGLSQLHPWEKIGSKILASIGSRHLMWPVFKALAQKGMAASGSTQLANLAGHPALSLPLEQASDGMPIGMQFMAPFAHDAKLIALGSKLERDIPWKKAEVSVKFP